MILIAIVLIVIFFKGLALHHEIERVLDPLLVTESEVSKNDEVRFIY